MNTYLASTAQVNDWLHTVAQSADLLWPQPLGQGNFSFRPVAATTAFDLHRYRPSVVPPGRYLLPADETLFTYRRGPEGDIHYQPPDSPERLILAGVRPCDLKAIAELDAVMADAPADPLYLDRRAATAIIAVACVAPCDSRCFCAAAGSLDFRAGADICLTPLAAGVLVEVLSEEGDELLAGAALAPCADGEKRRREAEAARPVPFGRALAAPPAELPALLRRATRSPVFARHGERCFSCGTCNLVCPTCYCFEVRDDMALDGASGRRSRTWDSCMIPGFAEVAGGHNFRARVGERQRHRLKRKFEYLPERFGLGSFCVGCGRCGRQCTADIDILVMMNEIVAEAGGAA